MACVFSSYRPGVLPTLCVQSGPPSTWINRLARNKLTLGRLLQLSFPYQRSEAADDAAFTRQINDPGLPAVRDASPYRNLFLRAISISTITRSKLIAPPLIRNWIA